MSSKPKKDLTTGKSAAFRHSAEKTDKTYSSAANGIRRKAICADSRIFLPVSDSADRFFSKISDFLIKIASKKASAVLFFLFVFCAVSLNNFICGFNPFTLHPEVAGGTYQFYICDYSCGFVSRVLVGAVITRFTDAVTVELIGLITSAANILSLVLVSFFIGLGMKYSVVKRNFTCFAICMSALACPFVSVWCSAYYGLLDVFLLICFLLAAFSSDSSLRMVVPAVMCALGLCIQFSFMFQFAPAVLCVLFFYIFYKRDNKKSVVTAAGFAFAAVVTAGLFIWFAFFANSHLKCTADEYDALMLSRLVVPDFVKEQIEERYRAIISAGSYTVSERQKIRDLLYAESSYFKDYFHHYIFSSGDVFLSEDNNAYPGFITFFKANLVKNARYRDTPAMIRELLLTSPFIVYSLFNSGKNIHFSKGIKKLPFIAVFAASLQIIPSLIISTDTFRFVTPAVISALYMNFVTEYNLPHLRKKRPKHRGFFRGVMGIFIVVLWLISVIIIRKYNLA